MALRHRLPAREHDDPAADSAPTAERAEQLEHELDALKKHTPRHFYSTRRFIFPLGIIVGILLGFVLVQPTDLTDFQTHLALLLDQYELNVLPALPRLDFELPAFDLSRFESEWRRVWASVPEPWKLNNNGLEFTVGDALAARGLYARHPVVLVPGIISTGLESWSTAPAYRTFFRQKLWGGFSMLSQVMFNKERWMAALTLDPVTGLDPPGAKVRAAEGIDAASSFIQGYWLWCVLRFGLCMRVPERVRSHNHIFAADPFTIPPVHAFTLRPFALDIVNPQLCVCRSKIIENLAVVNYDTNNLHLAPYDWRLAYSNLELRDGYFSKLKTTIEGFRRREGHRVVLVAHSMGSTVFKWVESPLHGKGGPDWVENHIEALITIAGTHLGVVKAMSAFLSGEMKDTVQVNPAGAYILERFFSRKERQKLFRSWAGSASMWMKGGDAVWGNATFAPDDLPHNMHTHGELIVFRSSVAASDTEGVRLSNMTSSQASNWILERTPTHFQQMVESNYSFGIERDVEALERNNLDPRKWSNPLEIQLPHAPTTKFYCVYGHGKDTERSYWYTREHYEYDDVAPDVIDATCANASECTTPRAPLDMPLVRISHIDAEYTDEEKRPKVVNGVRMGEGDGTVSLLSLGAMCVEGWKRERWNPAGIEVVTVELPHNPSPTIPRGGGTTSDHVDILGSTRMNEIILKVATGAGDEVQNSFVSRIREYAQKIQWD
ncbi:phospholipid:diacylglycerol acyltransferase [Wolfiporia cocos MD-104 SS10]|uniref:Phospholipid:diacylglycerol acyltransferase n=1 Tax=Wolfiporia cocos (strain MD-104) TaxID=742152 RepID=A0A2H3J3G7_WOLCO|nr:phospholipid:diacylglycerol acyltransferase [Wolfiporia cocos MD-104 SS10]